MLDQDHPPGGIPLSPLFGVMMRKFIVTYLPSGSIASPDPAIALFAFFLCTIVGVACSFFPALRAARIVPMEVLRNE